MKICPRCQKTYPDDNLNFCLEDGSTLTAAAAEPAPTLLMNQPQTTGQQQAPGTQSAWNTPPQQYSMQPQKKSSKTWIWVVLILGVLVLVCGGGFLGFLFYVGSQAEKTVNLANSIERPPPPANKGSNSTTPSTSGRTDLETVDLVAMGNQPSVYGKVEVNGDELSIASTGKLYYFVLVAPAQYTTDDADTRVTLRNVDNASGSLGYGLIFHSNPTPLQQDYAFLIDTKRKKYRVVHHEPKKETPVVSWTSSPAIKDGTAENTLEARDLDDKIELYINGTMVTSIKNVYGYTGGVPGIYSGDGVKIAFKNLEIRK